MATLSTSESSDQRFHFCRRRVLGLFFLSAALMRAFNVDLALVSFSSRFDCHSASRSFAICFIVRPVLTDWSSSFFEGGFALPPVFKISHWFFSPSRPRIRTSVHSPCAFLPASTR